MKNRIFSFLSLALFVATSCVFHGNEPIEEPDPTPDEPYTLTAYLENTLAKTSIEIVSDGGKVTWNPGDLISVNGAVFSATPDAANATKAEFDKVDGPDPSGTLAAYYPAGLVTAEGPVLPSVFDYEGNFNMPMYATGTERVLTFRNICSVFAVKVKSSVVSAVSSISIASDNHAMSGSFSVSDDGFAVLAQPDLTLRTVTLRCPTPVEVAEDGTTFYIPVPAEVYSRIRFCVKGTAQNGDNVSLYMLTSATKSITVAGNTIYRINFASNYTPVQAAVSNNSNAEDINDERH